MNKKEYDKSFEKSDLNIVKICFSGGPCGGKSTALQIISKKLKEQGSKVLTVHELPTSLISSGVDLEEIYTSKKPKPEEFLIDFQEMYLRQQIINEDFFCKMAELHLTSSAENRGQKFFILCDRGTIDTQAMMPESRWEKICERGKWNHFQLNNMMYDMVLFFGSVADGFPELYSNQNNEHRKIADVQSALYFEQLLKNSWVGHHNLHYIRTLAGEDIERKVERAYEIINKAYFSSEAKESLVHQLSLEGSLSKALDTCFGRVYEIEEFETQGQRVKIIKKDGLELGVEKNLDYSCKRMDPERVLSARQIQKGEKIQSKTYKERFLLAGGDFCKISIFDIQGKSTVEVSASDLDIIMKNLKCVESEIFK